MNIAFFLTPKNEVVVLDKEMTLRQAMEKMEFHRYSQVPVLDKKGRYMFTLSEGDILWHLKQQDGLMFKDTEKEKIKHIKYYHTVKPVSINASVESLVAVSALQGFVPVVDDEQVFIGIIKRSDIISYCMDQMGLCQEVPDNMETRTQVKNKQCDELILSMY